jgi:hypothetical protein
MVCTGRCRTYPARRDRRLTLCSRLTSPELPEKDKLIALAEEYFANVHNLRSFGFIHKPSFMQLLDDQSTMAHRRNALLHVVCALGAKQVARF